MRAKGTVTVNLNDLVKAEKLGMKCEPETAECDMLLRPEHIVYAFKIKNEQILICIAGRELVIAYEEEIWNRLQQIMPV